MILRNVLMKLRTEASVKGKVKGAFLCITNSYPEPGIGALNQ